MGRKQIVVGLCLSFASAQLALAQDNAVISADDLVKDPDRYLNQKIELRDAFCFVVTHGYECRTRAPLRIATNALPAAAKAIVDNECNELDRHELPPACRFTLQMVPTEVTTMEGDYIRNGQQATGRVTVLTVDVVAAKKE